MSVAALSDYPVVVTSNQPNQNIVRLERGEHLPPAFVLCEAQHGGRVHKNEQE